MSTFYNHQLLLCLVNYSSYFLFNLFYLFFIFCLFIYFIFFTYFLFKSRNDLLQFFLKELDMQKLRCWLQYILLISPPFVRKLFLRQLRFLQAFNKFVFMNAILFNFSCREIICQEYFEKLGNLNNPKEKKSSNVFSDIKKTPTFPFIEFLFLSEQS